jgi:hypothetical protein
MTNIDPPVSLNPKSVALSSDSLNILEIAIDGLKTYRHEI